MTTLHVGTWHEVSRDIDNNPSYYAADWERLQSITGDYPVNVTFHSRFAYNRPIPEWALVAIDTTRVDGYLYSGIAGRIVGSTELPKGEAKRYVSQTYPFHLPALVKIGRVTLKPEFAWLGTEEGWQHPDAPQTYEQLAELAKVHGVPR